MNGTNTLKSNDFYVSQFGIWIYIENVEYFISFKEYPELRKHTIDEISNFYFDRQNNIHWEELDIDIELDSLKDPKRYPLKYIT